MVGRNLPPRNNIRGESDDIQPGSCAKKEDSESGVATDNCNNPGNMLELYEGEALYDSDAQRETAGVGR